MDAAAELRQIRSIRARRDSYLTISSYMIDMCECADLTTETYEPDEPRLR